MSRHADGGNGNGIGGGSGPGGSGPGGNWGQSAPDMRQYPVQFMGHASEYFRIWVVNFFLSIITLGIYSAWAKVRRQRYFYGNTFLDGHNFEYHARPKQILIGRIIAVSLILAINVLANLHPLLGLLPLAFILVFPWFVNRSLRFNARVTSYRNVRFDFEQTSYWWALFVFGIMPVISAFSLFLLSPVSRRLKAKYVADGLRFGNARFASDPPIGALYGNFFLSVLLGIGSLIAIGAVVYVATQIVKEIGPEQFQNLDLNKLKFEWDLASILKMIVALLGNFLMLILLFSAFAMPYGFLKAGNRNVVYNATRIDGKYYPHSDLGRMHYGWILFSNLMATLFSFGLLHAWGVVRVWRYTVKKSSLISPGELEVFTSSQPQVGSAFAAEYMDIDGFDFGF